VYRLASVGSPIEVPTTSASGQDAGRRCVCRLFVGASLLATRGLGRSAAREARDRLRSPASRLLQTAGAFGVLADAPKAGCATDEPKPAVRQTSQSRLSGRRCQGRLCVGASLLATRGLGRSAACSRPVGLGAAQRVRRGTGCGRLQAGSYRQRGRLELLVENMRMPTATSAPRDRGC